MNHSKKLSYTCKIFSVWEEDLLLPNGRTVSQIWIEHQPTVAVAAVNHNQELLLIRQFRKATGKDLLEIPAGTMNKGEESPSACAIRELAEETGFRAGRLSPLFAGYLVPGYCNEFMYFFLAQDLFYEPLPPDEDERIEVIPTRFDEARALLENGTIIDAKTALGIILADNYLNDKTNFSKTSL